MKNRLAVSTISKSILCILVATVGWSANNTIHDNVVRKIARETLRIYRGDRVATDEFDRSSIGTKIRMCKKSRLSSGDLDKLLSTSELLNIRVQDLQAYASAETIYRNMPFREKLKNFIKFDDNNLSLKFHIENPSSEDISYIRDIAICSIREDK